MSTYRILPLKFTAPVHFGDASGGGGLDAVQPVCRADTFFSALCSEAARMGKTELNRLVNKVSQEEIAFSDLFPWYLRDGSYEWYVPKPVISVQPKETKSETLQKARNLASFRKKSKKRAFLRASDLGLYIDDLRYGSASLEEEPVFGETLSAVHFNSRTRTPYSAGSYFFSPSAGLYVLIRMDDSADWEWLEPLICIMGMTGIGGRKSSGMGSFIKAHDSILLSEENENADEAVLSELLKDRKTDCQMALSVFLPTEDELEIAAGGTGLWIQRSGFTWSPGMESPVKTKSIYMLSAGSCFVTRLHGRIADVRTSGVNHPVFRYGKGLFLGVPK